MAKISPFSAAQWVVRGVGGGKAVCIHYIFLSHAKMILSWVTNHGQVLALHRSYRTSVRFNPSLSQITWDQW